MKYFLLLAAGILLLLAAGCEFFSSPQERSGINPKPFNSQAGWETQPNGGRIWY